MNMQLSGGSEGFGGIVMDTACTGASVCSEREYRRYCRDVGLEYNILPNSSAWVSFGDANKVTGQGRMRSLGIAIIKGYLPDLDTVFEFDAHIMSGVDTPLLMSLNDMDALGMDLRTMNSELFIDGWGQKLARDEKNRLVLKWKYRVECLYTDRELLKFHRAFGHTSVDRIMKSLHAADYSQLDEGTGSKLQDIERKCECCQYNSSRPKHFSISQHYLGNRFNHVVEVDIFKVDTPRYLHWYRFHRRSVHIATKRNCRRDLETYHTLLDRRLCRST
jgi:hypothetical protein